MYADVNLLLLVTSDLANQWNDMHRQKLNYGNKSSLEHIPCVSWQHCCCSSSTSMASCRVYKVVQYTNSNFMTRQPLPVLISSTHACARGKAIGLSICRRRQQHENRQISRCRHVSKFVPPPPPLMTMTTDRQTNCFTPFACMQGNDKHSQSEI